MNFAGRTVLYLAVVALAACATLFAMLGTSSNDRVGRTEQRNGPGRETERETRVPGKKLRQRPSSWDRADAAAQLLLAFGADLRDPVFRDALRHTGAAGVRRLVDRLRKRDAHDAIVIVILQTLAALKTGSAGSADIISQWAHGKDVGVLYGVLIPAMVSVSTAEQHGIEAVSFVRGELQRFESSSVPNKHVLMMQLVQALGSQQLPSSHDLLLSLGQRYRPPAPGTDDMALGDLSRDLGMRRAVSQLARTALQQLARLDTVGASEAIWRLANDRTRPELQMEALSACADAARADPDGKLAQLMRPRMSEILVPGSKWTRSERSAAMRLVSATGADDWKRLLAVRPDTSDGQLFGAWAEAVARTARRSPDPGCFSALCDLVSDGFLANELADPRHEVRSLVMHVIAEKEDPAADRLVLEKLRELDALALVVVLEGSPAGFWRRHREALAPLAQRAFDKRNEPFGNLALRAAARLWAEYATDHESMRTRLEAWDLGHVVEGGSDPKSVPNADVVDRVGTLMQGQGASDSAAIEEALASEDGVERIVVEVPAVAAPLHWTHAQAIVRGLIRRTPRDDAIAVALLAKYLSNADYTAENRSRLWVLAAIIATRSDHTHAAILEIVNRWRQDADSAHLLKRQLRTLETFIAKVSTHGG